MIPPECYHLQLASPLWAYQIASCKCTIKQADCRKMGSFLGWEKGHYFRLPCSVAEVIDKRASDIIIS